MDPKLLQAGAEQAGMLENRCRMLLLLTALGRTSFQRPEIPFCVTLAVPLICMEVAKSSPPRILRRPHTPVCNILNTHGSGTVTLKKVLMNPGSGGVDSFSLVGCLLGWLKKLHGETRAYLIFTCSVNHRRIVFM